MPKLDGVPTGAPCWIDLMSSDTDKSRAFYGDLFGWTSEAGGEEYGGYINFFKDGAQVAGLMAKQPEMGEMPDVWSIYLSVEDADAVAAAVPAHGGEVLVAPMDVVDLGKMAVFTDAGGAAIGAWQPKEFKSFQIAFDEDTPGWFELHTRDFDKTIAFYEAVYGWTTRVEGDTDEFRYTTMVVGEEQHAGVMDASAWLPDGVPAHWSIYFKVDDTDATLAKIGKLGGNTVVPGEDTPYGRLATAVDPTGAIFKLVG
jgi:uncharacterized protein